MINRRKFLETATSGAIGAWALTKNRAFTRLERIGVQLYTVRNDMAKDFEGTLQKVASLGYKEVEFAGYYDRTPQQVKEILNRFGLESPSVHVPLKAIQSDFERSIEAAKIIGHKMIVCPYLDANDRKTIDNYKSHAATFNKAGESCKKAGIEFAYHNHDFELMAIDGTVPLDLLLAETEKNLVKLEMDLYWMKRANANSLAYLDKHPGRTIAFHVKDMDTTSKMFFTEVGRGIINFKEIFTQTKNTGVKYYFVEQDQCPGPPLDSLKISIDYLRQLEF
jgi:sugar phosphate isomerase/epimerase